ncbi:MAG: ABC transporter substrate-binding protein [Promethearchaeota archaeon]
MRKQIKYGLLLFLTVGFFLSAPKAVKAEPKPAQTLHPFVMGTFGTVYDLDPHNSWDSPSNDVLAQVFEPLISVDYSNPSGGYVARLATKYQIVDSMTYEFTLRQGVYFHDGTPFNATAAKWNFDRMVNISINDPNAQLAHGFWAFPAKNFKDAGVTTLDWAPDDMNVMVWNRTEVVSDYKIRIHLNFPFSAFLDMLCYTGMSMISPTAHAANFNSVWDASATTLVGTGPFIFKGHDPVGGTTTFWGNPNYWNGAPYITNLTFSYIEDSDSRNTALLTGDVDFLPGPNPDYMDQFKADPNIEVKEGPANLVIQYLGLSTINIEKPVRQAITWALNYTYIIEELLNGYATRLTGPIPNGMKYYNPNIPYPTMDVAKARQILIDAGKVPAEAASWTDAQWQAKADGPDPVDTINYTYNIGNQMREDLLVLLTDNCRDIGIKVTDAGTDWGTYLSKAFGNIHELEAYFLGWGPDFNNPVTYMFPLWDPSSFAASHGLNDSYITERIYKALLTTNEAQIQKYYDEITDRLVNDQAPWAFCYQGYNLDAWRKEWDGCEGNFMGDLWIYPIHEDASGWTPGATERAQRIEPVVIPGFPVGAVGLFAVVALAGVVLAYRRKIRA